LQLPYMSFCMGLPALQHALQPLSRTHVGCRMSSCGGDNASVATHHRAAGGMKHERDSCICGRCLDVTFTQGTWAGRVECAVRLETPL
jgi:hypothetical protein